MEALESLKNASHIRQNFSLCFLSEKGSWQAGRGQGWGESGVGKTKEEEKKKKRGEQGRKE